MRLVTRQQRSPPVSTATAALVGIGVGVACFVFALIVGLLFAQWSIVGFLSHVSLTMLGEFLLMVSFTVLTLGVPVAAYLRFRLQSPVVTLMLIILFWVVLGIGGPILTQFFGLAYYAIWFAPFYVVVYLALGAVELLLRRITAPPSP